MNVEILTDDENIQWDQLRLEIKDCVCNSGIKKQEKHYSVLKKAR